MSQLTINVNVIICMLAAIFQREASSQSKGKEFTAPYGLQFTAVTYFPPLSSNSKLRFTLNAVTWYKDATIYLQLFSSVRVFSVIRAYEITKYRGDNLYTFENLKIPIFPDEVIVYQLFSVTSPFTVTLIRFEAASGSLIDALALQPDVFNDVDYALVLESNKIYHLILFNWDKFTASVKPPYLWRNTTYSMKRAKGLSLSILLLTRKQPYQFVFQLTASKPIRFLLFDAEKMTTVNVISKVYRHSRITHYWLALPWVNGTSYVLSVYSLVKKASVNVICNVYCEATRDWYRIPEHTRNETFKITQRGKHVETVIIRATPFENKHVILVQMSLTNSKSESIIRMDPFKTVHKLDVTYKFSLMKNGIQLKGIGFVVSMNPATWHEAHLKKPLWRDFKFDSKPLSAISTDEVYIQNQHSERFIATRFNIDATRDSHHVLEAVSGNKVDHLFYVFISDANGGPSLVKFPDIMNYKFPYDEKKCHANRSKAGDGYDNDCDGKIDEEHNNDLDDDQDGLVDEDLEMPPSIDGKWGAWGAWTCAVQMRDCNSQGLFQRKRFCDEPFPEFGGKPCLGYTLDHKDFRMKCKGQGKCYLDCPEGTYGWGCKAKCKESCFNQTCNKLYGECNNGCVPGYIPSSGCHKECHIENYGPDCNYLCPLECKVNCNYTNGQCIIPTEPNLQWLATLASRLIILVIALSILALVFPLGICWGFLSRRRTKEKPRPTVEGPTLIQEVPGDNVEIMDFAEEEEPKAIPRKVAIEDIRKSSGVDPRKSPEIDSRKPREKASRKSTEIDPRKPPDVDPKKWPVKVEASRKSTAL